MNKLIDRINRVLWNNPCKLQMFEGNYTNLEAQMADEVQEKKLLKALEVLLAEYPDYDAPRLRKDGDIVIPLDAVLKKNRLAYQSFADAFSEMMSEDLGPKRSSTWVK